jgi:F-type H+-transporting ATPase subunit b
MLQLNWSTILLQILNFVIMAFILWRFLFKPVVRILDERSARVTSALTEAEQKRQAADEMREEYETKLAQAEERVIAMQQQGEEELARARREVLDETRQELLAMRDNAEREIREVRQQEVAQHRKALGDLVTRLSAQLISESTDRAFQQASIEQFIERLGTLEDERYHQATGETEEEAVLAQVVSAQELPTEPRAQLEREVLRLAGQPAEIVYRVDPSLVAGATLRFGDVLIDGSVAGQLEQLRQNYVSELERGTV